MTLLYLNFEVWGVTDWAFSISGSNCSHTVVLCHFPCFFAQLSPPSTGRHFYTGLGVIRKKNFVYVYLSLMRPQSPSDPPRGVNMRPASPEAEVGNPASPLRWATGGQSLGQSCVSPTCRRQSSLAHTQMGWDGLNRPAGHTQRHGQIKIQK